MKQYFTKYLPVEGDIKEGDLYLNDDEDIREAGKCPAWKEEYSKLFINMKKVKLFLCSRTIALGDEYYHDSFHPYPEGDVADTNTKVMNANMMITNEGENYEGDHSYKVIGEISPDALTYVKEGEELDESDIQLCSQLGYNYSLEYLHNLEQLIKIHTNVFLRIKGPCGHFH